MTTIASSHPHPDAPSRLRSHSTAFPFAVACLLSLASCSSPVKETGPVSTFQQEGGSAGFGGETIIDTVTTNATIVSLDSPQRRMVLKYPDGRVAPYKAGPEVANFAALKVGDEVKTTVADQMGVSVARAGAQSGDSQKVSVVKGPQGTAGGSVIDVENVTGKVLRVDYLQHSVTMQINNGQTRTVKVLEMINLTDLQPGDEVTMKITEARTFAVEKP